MRPSLAQRVSELHMR